MAYAPAFVKGAVNLRGAIVLNMGTQVVGVVVDGVSDVITCWSSASLATACKCCAISKNS